MTKAAFTYDGTDPGDFGVILERRRIDLVPKTRDRAVQVPGRPGSHDFGSDLGERQIDLDLFFDRSTVTALDSAIRDLAELFDPTDELTTDGVNDRAFKQLIFDTESDRYWLAKITGGPDIERIVTTGKTRVTMRCSDPFAYSTAQYVVQGGSATLSGFTAYRQIPAIPDVGAVHGWNLVKNGGFNQAVGSEWTLHANAARVVDATSVTGTAVRLIATAANQNSTQTIPVEPGKTYSFAIQMRADGTNLGEVFIQWLDASGAQVGSLVGIALAVTGTWTEYALTNQTAPGNARNVKVYHGSQAAGIFFYTAIRVKQQTTAPAAWSSADQQVLGNKGLVIYEATTNIAGPDADMETAGVANYVVAGAGVTIAKETGIANKFAGTQSLKIAATGAHLSGDGAQNAAYFAASALTQYTVSARVKSDGVNSVALRVFSQIGGGSTIVTSSSTTSADWDTLSVTFTTAAGETGLIIKLILVSVATWNVYTDNWACEAKAYNTLNSDPSGQAYTTGTRTASSHTETLESGFDIADFGRVVPFRPDHAYNAHSTVDRWVWCDYIDANNYIGVYVNATDGSIRFRKVRAGIASEATDAAASAFAAGDTLSVGVMHNATDGLWMLIRKNGVQVGAGAFTNTSAEAKLTLTGTPTRYLGRFGTAGTELDGTVGVDRGENSTVTTAQVTTAVTSPYAQQDEAYESVVWRFDGSAVVENYASGVLTVDVGGTYKVEPTIELTSVGSYTGAVTFTDSYGNVLSWTGTLVANDVLKVETATRRVYLNGSVSMSGVTGTPAFPLLKPDQRNTITIGTMAASNIKALKATFRNRWL